LSHSELKSDETVSRGFKAPDTFVILFFVALFAWGLTWVVPAGRFVASAGGIDLGNYIFAGRQSIGLFGKEDSIGFLNFLFEGLVTGDRYSATIGLMAFLLIVGGAFGIIMRTGAMEAALAKLINRPESKNDVLVPGLFVAFSLAGAVFGMGEEAIVFVMILLPGFLKAGYDSLTVLLVTYVATQIGFATSWMNPFSVVIAQGIAGLEIMSGALFRAIMWIIFTVIGAVAAFLYAKRIRKSPEHSLMFQEDQAERAERLKSVETELFGLGHGLILFIILAGIGWVAWGVGVHQYYFPEIAAQFFAMGVAAAIVGILFRLNKINLNACGEAFKNGALQLAPAALIIGFAKGVVVLLGGDDPSEVSVLNTVLYGMASVTDGLPTMMAAGCMLGLQSVVNLFVVSGSGQAALTMPLMAPLSDLIGVQRQTAVLAFQLGDGLMNLIVPSSAALMGSLAAAKVGWGVWVRFIWKALCIAMCLALIFILIAVGIGYS
jgi:uncharacterized ion transporter superfamily protein YfcC